MNTLSKITKKSSIFFLTLATAAIMTGCGQSSDNKPANTQNDVQPEQTVEQEVVESSAIEVSEEEVVESTVESEVVEETVEEVDPSTLSDEEWIKSLNLDTGAFLIINETTGARKALEDGEHYKLVETDIFVLSKPSDWELKDRGPTWLLLEEEIKYKCIFQHVDFESLQEETEFIANFKDADGNDVTISVYLSK